MAISKVRVKQFRNLSSVQLSPGPSFNFFLGDNGSGKTSLLEALYVLAYGKSFRSSQLKSAISYGQEALLSCVQLDRREGAPIYLGLTKERQRKVQAKVAGKNVSSVSDLSKQLPLLFISPDSFSLLAGGPEGRRRFIDWGAFHCIQAFSESWQQFSRLLKQRNAALKAGDRNQLEVWDSKWCSVAQQLTEHRKSYLKLLLPCFDRVLQQLCPLEGLAVSYWRGWSELETLPELVHSMRAQELRVGHGLVGPQRADLQISLYDYPAAQLLSRGQQKMLVCALFIAQGMVLTETLGRECIYLVDDLSSELDGNHRFQFLNYLNELGVQSFITGVESSLLAPIIEAFPRKMFSVEQGVISSISTAGSEALAES